MTEHPHADQWPRIRELAESEGLPAVIDAIHSEADPETRRGLFSLATQRLSREEWSGRGLDATLEIARAAIDEGVRQSESESDPEASAKRIEFANVLSYNLSADLADCWPDDDRKRERRHIEAGLAAAEDCLRWREQLDKGPFPFSIAWWAHGIHSLSLGNSGGAVVSFDKSLAAARAVAIEQERSREAGADATFGVNLGTGYLGLARWRHGDAEGEAQFHAALAALAAQGEAHPEERGDCEFGIGQLECAAKRSAP